MNRDEMIQILENTKDLIENKKFEEFYELINLGDRHYFTDLFLKSNINPLDYMTEVPWYYANSLNNLENIDIPNNITYIGLGAFSSCSNLTNVTFEENSQLTGIGSYIFYGCSSLMSITLPSGVTHIGYDAFENCYSLANVYYRGSEHDWKKIKIDEGNDYLQSADIHHNSKI